MYSCIRQTGNNNNNKKQQQQETVLQHNINLVRKIKKTIVQSRRNNAHVGQRQRETGKRQQQQKLRQDDNAVNYTKCCEKRNRAKRVG